MLNMELKEIYKTDDLPDSALIVHEDDGRTKKERGALFNKARNRKLILYTQVDGDSGEVIYVKGGCLVNRTGVYALLPSTYRRASRKELEDLIAQLLHAGAMSSRQKEILDELR